MSVGDLLVRAHRQGLSLELENGRLKIRGSRKKVEPGFLEEIDAQKEKLVSRLEASRAWARTVEEVSGKWNDLKARQGEAPWLPPEEDDALQAEAGKAIRNCDLERALRVMERWRRAWEDSLLAEEGGQRGTGGDTSCRERAGGASLADRFDDSPRSPSVIQMFEEARKRYKRARGEDR